MRYERFPDGGKVPVIGLGTWTIGGGVTASQARDGESVQLLRAALEMGYTHIDTAEFYGAGHAEEIVGRAVRDFCRGTGGRREELLVTTKVWRSNLRYKGVLKALEGSLRRLQMDYVDLYLVHWPNPSIPLKETFRALNELVDRGLTRRVGVSNFGLERLKDACGLSAAPISTNQVEYNLLQRTPERSGLLDYCRMSKILLTAYEPLGKGSLMEHPGVRDISGRCGLSPAQLALAWLLQRKRVITIPMSASERHLRENLQAPDLRLSGEVVQALEALI